MNGFINVLKTPGLTSSDVVVRLRRMLNQKKVGHAGTLDPAAAGVLPIMLGKATRLFDYLQSGYKEYIAAFEFGVTTDTLDAEGKITEWCEKTISEDMIRACLPQFIGDIEQLPPSVSAININGQRAYALARQGKDVSIPARRVTIHQLEFMDKLNENCYLFKIRCSKGTYVRSLCRDIASKLDTVAYMPFLLRTKSGTFTLDRAYTLEDIEEKMKFSDAKACVEDMDKPIDYMPMINIKSSLYDRVLNGNAIRIAEPAKGEVYRVYCRNQFIGIGVIKKSDKGQHLKIKKMLVERE